MTIRTILMSAATSALLAGGALAQETTEPAPMPEGDAAMGDVAAPAEPAFTSVEEMTVGQVLGMRTEDPAGDSIGEIDYVIQGEQGLEAVIGIGGFLGLGEYTVALPMSDFTLNEDFSAFVLDNTKEELEAIPEIDESELESLPDELIIGDLMAEAGMETGDAPAADAATDPAATTEEPMAEEPATDDGAMTEEPAADEGAMTEEPATDDAATDMGTDESAAEPADESAEPAEGSDDMAEEPTEEEGAEETSGN